MSELDQDDTDPFYWDSERLAKVLCDPNQPWFPRNPKKLPPLDLLSQRLQEYDVDGELLLAYESVGGNLNELFPDWGLTRHQDRFIIRKAVTALRNQSPAYLRWKQKQDGETSGGAGNAAIPQTSSSTTATTSVQQQMLESNGVSAAPKDAEVNTAPSQDVEANTASGQDVAIGNTDTGPEQVQKHPDVNGVDAEDSDIEANDEEKPQRPNKRRRIAPATVSSDAIVRSELFHVPTEADAFDRERNRQPSKRVGNAAAPYLGSDAFTWEAMLTNLPAMGPTHHRSFAHSGHTLPLGHRLRVNRAMKAILRGNKTEIRSMVKSFETSPDSDSPLGQLIDSGEDAQHSLSSDDRVLGAYGEEPGDDEIDPETAREMEEDLAEIEQEARRHGTLSKEEVSEEIDDAIVDLVSEWKERKLPSLEQRAYRIWTKARLDRTFTLGQKLRSSTAFLSRLEGRIAKARQEILDISWTNPRHVRTQVGSLEQSIFDQEYHSWLVKTLNGPKPVKPAPVPRLPKVKRSQRWDKDEEVLTSDSDESLGDFIVEDDVVDIAQQEADGGMAGAANTTAYNGPVSGAVKADPSPVPRSRSPEPWGFEPWSELRGRNVIDLTTPEPDALPEESHFTTEARSQAKKSAESEFDVDEAPEDEDGDEDEDEDEDGDEDGDESEDEIENEIGAENENAGPDSRKLAPKRTLPDTFWQGIPSDMTVSDDEKRLIYRLWKIGELKRDEIYQAANDCEKDGSSFWDCHILKGLNPNVPLGNISATIARLFLYYAQPKTAFREAVFNKVRRKDQRKILDKKACLDSFFSVILRLIPCFPKVLLVSALAGGEDGAGDDQVIFDAHALQVRARDQERIEEQDRRRAELREKLAEVQSIPKDKSRLIINEAKEENEGLIYIRGDPARLIKDHQIDGVRFMWNSIIASRDAVRHGCVLAHSMGLGKSMQVITLLLAIVYASKSPDESIRSQIPEDLRVSRTLVLCPASLSRNWRDELLTWDSQQELGSVYLVASTERSMSYAHNKAMREKHIYSWAEGGGVLVLGYELFVSFSTKEPHLAQIIARRAAIVVADEAHTIKNPISKRRLACSTVATPARIALTGSPLANSATEYYSTVDWVAPQYMGSIEEFTNNFATPIHRGLYKGADPATKRTASIRLNVLRKYMAPKVHRCGNTVLREELKPKREFMFFLPLTEVQRRLYDGFVDVIDTSDARFLGAVSSLTLICMHPQCFRRKVDDVLQENDHRASDPASDGEEPKDTAAQVPEDLTLTYEVAKKMDQLMLSVTDDITDIRHSWRFRLLFAVLDECRAVGDKVIIFSRRMTTLNLLEEIFQKQGRTSLRLDGQTPMIERLGMIKDFNSSDTNTEVFLISTKAGGVGLNIHGANRVIIMDFAHNPMDEQQAIGRAYRIGQEKEVFVYWFVSWGTHEAKLQSRLVFKKQLADRVVEGKDYQPWVTKDDAEAWVQKVWDTSPSRPLPASDVEDVRGSDSVADRLFSDAELSQGVLSVITTDTFEKEEEAEDVILTAAEQESVSKLVQRDEEQRLQHLSSVEPQQHSLEDTALSLLYRYQKQLQGSSLMIPAGSEHVRGILQAARDELASMDTTVISKRWTMLVERLAHPNFAIAVLNGIISPSFLAHTDESTLDRKVMELVALSPAELGKRARVVRGKHEDPEHLSMALRRRTQDGERLRMKRKDDEIALREVADRRRRRQSGRGQEQSGHGQEHQQWEWPYTQESPLPEWAHDAIRRGMG